MEIDAAWDGRRDMIDRQKTRQASGKREGSQLGSYARSLAREGSELGGCYVWRQRRLFPLALQGGDCEYLGKSLAYHTWFSCS